MCNQPEPKHTHTHGAPTLIAFTHATHDTRHDTHTTPDATRDTHTHDMGSLPNLNAIGLQSRRVADSSFKATALHRLPAPPLPVPSAPLTLPPLTPTAGGRHQLQQHRHSLTARKVHRTHSSGTTNHIWDDPGIEVSCGWWCGFNLSVWMGV